MSSFISTGDYADVTANDVMQYWEDDEATRVCLPHPWIRSATRGSSRGSRRTLARRKPVVVFAPGRTYRADHAGVRGGLGHAPDEAVDALFSQAGVMVVHQRGDMIDIAKIAARQPLPSGPRVRIITNSLTLAYQMVQKMDSVGLLRDPQPELLEGGCGLGRIRESGAGRLGRPALRLSGLRGGERLRQGHRGRHSGVGGCRRRGRQATDRRVLGLPSAAEH